MLAGLGGRTRRKGAQDDNERRRELASAPPRRANPTNALAAYLEAFFTEKGEGAPRGGRQRKLVTKTLAKRLPDLPRAPERRAGAADRAARSAAQRRGCGAQPRAVDVAQAVLAEYAHLKGARGLLDFDDLIARTLQLLERADAAWVLYKLDAGVDHILVDEAQDTSAPQWAILTKLSDEFLSGAGARSRRRTFFAVGDEKQSIFSFQGAAPEMFDAMRRELERRHREAERRFRPDSPRAFVPLRAARCSKASIACSPPRRPGAASPRATRSAPPHDAFHADLPGMIEVWAPIAPEAAPSREDWRMPLDASAPRRSGGGARASASPESIEEWLSPRLARARASTTRRASRAGSAPATL